VEQLVAVLVMAVILGAGTWWQYRLSKGRMWHPLWLAFSMTSAAILFVTAGIAGFRLDRRTAFFADTRWSDDVLWWQVGLGLIFAMLAVLFWRHGIRYTDDLLRSRPR
jgi:hypothetical protein